MSKPFSIKQDRSLIASTGDIINADAVIRVAAEVRRSTRPSLLLCSVVLINCPASECRTGYDFLY